VSVEPINATRIRAVHAAQADDRHLGVCGRLADLREVPRRVAGHARALIECEAEGALASSAAGALERVESFEPKVIESDISMPGEDGYDFSRQVRTTRSAKDLPVAALTAFARVEVRNRALRAGFQTPVVKFVDSEELKSVIVSLAGRTGRFPSLEAWKRTCGRPAQSAGTARGLVDGLARPFGPGALRALRAAHGPGSWLRRRRRPPSGSGPGRSAPGRRPRRRSCPRPAPAPSSLAIRIPPRSCR
jgi:CheY-like chemotaxis protein